MNTPLSGKIFWVEPTLENLYWFILAFAFLGAVIFFVRALYHRRITQETESDLEQRLEQAGLLGKPEEMVARDLIQRYGIEPASHLFSSLPVYDEIACNEMRRVIRAPMPLSDRIDRIEYLYSIRIHAFAHEPAVSGVSALGRGENRAHLPAVGSPPLTALALEGGPLEPNPNEGGGSEVGRETSEDGWAIRGGDSPSNP